MAREKLMGCGKRCTLSWKPLKNWTKFLIMSDGLRE